MRRKLRLCNKTKSDIVPVDLLIEILNRLPLKYAGRFLLVSKSWAKIIRSKDFIRSFPHRSLNQSCRILISFSELDYQAGHLSWYFFSSLWSSSSTSTSTSFLSRITCTLTKRGHHYDTEVSYVNGLVSIGYCERQIICNPGTGKSKKCPIIKTSRPSLLRRFFGYDPVNDEYKVLCMKPGDSCAVPSSDIQVFTLGGKSRSWRMIDCSIPHSPWSSNALCMDGVVYYLAYTGTRMSLVGFDVKSEKFDIFVRIPDGFSFFSTRGPPVLLNYHGKVAARTITSEGANDLWVIEAGKQPFLEMSFYEVPERSLQMKGINHIGEFIFAPSKSIGADVTCYNHKEGSFKTMDIEVDVTRSNYFTPETISWIT
ncbi:unnamed protein product [Thlaspi arvense]|uniref:F-box domain-containing protein n=1 Tax=Thlaspi arvense TaxID=13288 RepID=A0AAU9RCS1_THLAR|nr:unnamed protein product [Thlaspi arvense]